MRKLLSQTDKLLYSIAAPVESIWNMVMLLWVLKKYRASYDICTKDMRLAVDQQSDVRRFRVYHEQAQLILKEAYERREELTELLRNEECECPIDGWVLVERAMWQLSLLPIKVLCGIRARALMRARFMAAARLFRRKKI